MVEAWGFFALGLVLLALGGDSIVKGASGLAQKLGATPFVAGLLLVAFGTSLPELFVNARAYMVGAQDLALGNAVGSNIVNFGLTLGLAAIAAPLLVRMRLLSPMRPASCRWQSRPSRYREPPARSHPRQHHPLGSPQRSAGFR